MECLLLQSSSIFENSNLIDQIRQTYIDLETDSTEDEVIIFLESALKYLEKDLDIKTTNELFSVILSCFSRFTKEFMPIFTEVLKKSRNNSSYIILTSFLLYESTQIKLQVNIPDYQSFVDDALKEILRQINNNEENLTLFDHKIPSQFQTNLIINLLLVSNLSEQLLLDYFPYILSQSLISENPKISLFYQKVLDSKLSKILPLTEDSNNEIIEFIASKNFSSVSKMTKQAISLIMCAVIFTKSGKETEIKIEGLENETILPFIAVSMIYLQEAKNSSVSNFSQLIQEAIPVFDNNNSPILNASLDSIIQNYRFVFESSIFPIDIIFQLFEGLLKKLIKDEYKANKKILISTVFDLTSLIQNNINISQFFAKNGTDFLNYVIQNLTEINSIAELKEKRLNLNAFDFTIVSNHLQDSESVDDARATVYFIEKLCYNQPQISSFEDLSAILLLFINELIQEEKWEDVLLIGLFMKKNGGYNDLQDFKEEKMPNYVFETLFGYTPNEQESIDDLIDHMLADPFLNKNEMSFYLLFKKMIADSNVLHNYICYIISRYHDHSLSIETHLTIFSRYFQLYPNEFIAATNQLYYFNSEKGILLKKPEFKLSSLQNSETSLSIISKLFNHIRKQQSEGNKIGSYQAFFCLRVIGCSFPFLFRDFKEIIDLILPLFDRYSVLLISNPNDEQYEQIKTVYSAMSFFISALQSSIVLDQFIGWLFENITSLTDSQILAFIVVLRVLYGDDDVKVFMQAWNLKLKFIGTLGELLSRAENQEAKLKHYFRLNIYNYIEETFDIVSHLSNIEAVHTDELSQFQNPFERAFESFYSTFPCLFVFSQIKFSCFSQRFVEFMTDVDNQREFYVSFDIQNNIIQRPNIFTINNLVQNLNKSESIDLDFMPSFNDSFSARIVRFIMSQPSFFYDFAFNVKRIPLVPEMYELLLNLVEKVAEIQNEERNDPNQKDFNIQTYVNDILLSHYSHENFYKNLFNEVMKSSVEKVNFQSLTNIFIQMSTNEIVLISILTSISDSLKNLHIKNIGNEQGSFLNGFNRLLEILNAFSNSTFFQNNFIFTCGDEILDIALSPRCRDNAELLLNVSNLFLLFEFNLPIQVTHLICFLLLLKSQKATKTALILCSSFDKQQLEDILHMILLAFDEEVNQGFLSNEFITLMNKYPLLFNDKTTELIPLLQNMLEKYSQSLSANNENEEDLEKIGTICNFLAPKRDISISLSMVVEKTSSLPQFIKEAAPSFWSLYDKYSNVINSILQKDPLFLNTFNFLLNYPELVSFNIRSSYFRKQMKKRLSTKKEKLSLNIKSDDILRTSFELLRDKTADELMTQFNVVYDNNKTVDHGGPTCDWFTKLAKEIFSQENGYFQCSEKNMSYQPSCLSCKKSDYLEFFKFAGQFIARALIEGICVDAHLTTSFCKQILHREPKLNDLEDADVSLFQGLQWTLENDVDPLEMKFEVYDETGNNQTVPLKENGTEINVTNENKKEYVILMANYALKTKIEKQIEAFVDGFDSLIPHDEIKIFTPNELDLLICGVPKFDIEDFKAHTVYQEPYTADSPVIKYFFSAISKWDNDQLIKLLQFITGCSRVTANGFEEFCEIAGRPITINSGGERNLLPQSHTCVNTLSLPQYENEQELNEKLLIAINQCDSFEII